MTQRLVYLNGAFVPEAQARISIFDCALMYGDMVFEMTRTFRQIPFRLDEHLDRLYDSLKYARLDCGLSQAEMVAATHETLERNSEALAGVDCQIMHNVTRGVIPVYDGIVPEGTGPVVTINVFPLYRHVGGMVDRYETGVHFVVPPQQSVPARYLDPKAKTRSRLHYKIAELQAAYMEEGAQALLTDEHGFVTEGTGNNFFMVRNGEVLTPRGRDILRGVSRGACLDLARGLGIPVRETDIEPYDVRQADEAWFTSTTICMVPITRFDFHTIGDGSPGPVYRRILQAWSEQVGVDIVAQARNLAAAGQNWSPES
jgi:branched-chain amino acid aminotransferase